MADLQDEEVVKKERKFFKCYGVLKTNVKGAREAVKTETDEESINRLIESLEAEEHEMVKLYNDLRSLRTPLSSGGSRGGGGFRGFKPPPWAAK